ncbi:MAG: hypothetical protein QOJ45_2098 [Verrucomicrobiota bacterium]|jgi:hypothetical protein
MSSKAQGIEMHEISLNPFKMHLTDAILSVHLAKEAQLGSAGAAHAIRAMLCRTAVAHAVFALESSANCFVERLPRSKEFREKAEMWPALEKFDFYLLSVPGAPKLPQDDKRVKATKDLIKLRDRHVHPRIVTYPVSQSETADIRIQIKMPETQTLNIPPFGWSIENAVTAINAVLDFLRLFSHITTIPAAGIRAILSDNMKCKDGTRVADTGHYNKILTVSRTIGVDVEFLLESD